MERNNPLIRVNPFWGVFADLRMTFLALTGRLGRELAKHGIVEQTNTTSNDASAALVTGMVGATLALNGWIYRQVSA